MIRLLAVKFGSCRADAISEDVTFLQNSSLKVTGSVAAQDAEGSGDLENSRCINYGPTVPFM